jgi:hypothetical protein
MAGPSFFIASWLSTILLQFISCMCLPGSRLSAFLIGDRLVIFRPCCLSTFSHHLFANSKAYYSIHYGNMSTSRDDSSCWICFDDGEDHGGQPVIHSGCSCRGSMGYCHISCLVKFKDQEGRQKRAIDSALW